MKTDRRLLGKALREAQSAAKLDVVMPVGDCCGTCSWAKAQSLAGKENPTALVASFYLKGMNKSSWKDMRKVYLNHNIPSEQLQTVLTVLGKYFKVEYRGEELTILLTDKEE